MLNTIYNQKVTILNKLRRADSQNNTDVWYKTVIEDAAWYSQVARTVQNNSVSIGSYIICLIPHHDEYLDYFEWKKEGNQDGHYTMSSGDYLILGEITEEVTAANIISVMANYEPRVCSVKHFEELHDRFNSHVQLRIEGT